ncbi:MAG: hypothetical protein IH984_00955 [Planctomycetes bacterium]|nr:hypothetical protein [Planctomycetota bacterium]
MTQIEIIVVLIVLIIIVALVLVKVSQLRRDMISLKDGSQIQQISQSMVVFSRELNGPFPVPSLIAPPSASGEEDYTLNHSANLYSLMTMRHYVNVELLVSPIEVSDHVLVDKDYDHGKYEPFNSSYWDDSFVMHIEDPKIGANGSYAHVAAVGDRRDVLHSSKISDSIPILGTRAYDQTILDPSQYLRSPVFRFTKPYDKWVGNIAFADGHVTTLETVFPQQTTFDPGSGAVPDNIFAAEFDHPNGKQAAADAFLCISIAATKYTVNDVYDPLDE